MDVSTCWPAEHEEQATLPAVEVRPDGHISQAVVLALLVEKVFAAHGLHAVLPSSFWYSEGMQGRQLASPSLSWYLPLPHGVH